MHFYWPSDDWMEMMAEEHRQAAEPMPITKGDMKMGDPGGHYRPFRIVDVPPPEPPAPAKPEPLTRAEHQRLCKVCRLECQRDLAFRLGMAFLFTEVITLKERNLPMTLALYGIGVSLFGFWCFVTMRLRRILRDAPPPKPPGG